MRKIFLVAALAAMTGACDQIAAKMDQQGQTDAPASAAADAAPAATEAAAEPPEPAELSPSEAASSEDFTLTIENPQVSQIEGYWWDDGSLYETFRDGRYVAIFKQGGTVATNETYRLVNNCQERVPDPNGRGIQVGDAGCFDVTAVTNNQFLLNHGGREYTEQLVTGAMVQTLDDAFAALPAR